MKIIDLLNKIANKEKVPNKIMYENIIYNWDKIGYLHYDDGITSERAFLEGIRTDMVLNKEIKIIEENKEIEELDCYLKGSIGESLEILVNKINELVRVVNKLIKEREEK